MFQRASITGRPLALLALAAVAGILLAEFAPPSPALHWALGALALLAAAWVFRQGAWCWTVLLAAATFALLHSLELGRTRDHPLRLVLESRVRPMPIEAHGRVQTTLRSDLPGGEPGEALFLADEVRCPPTGQVWRGPVALRLFTGGTETPVPGEYRVEGRLRLPSAPDNPGQFDARQYRLRLGLVADLSSSRAVLVKAESPTLMGLLAGAAEACRAWVAQTLSVDLANAPTERAIILAMVLGTIDDGSKELEKPFRDSGTLHIFAVSGLHVAIVGAIFWALLRPWGLPRSILVPVLIGLLFGYAFVTGLRPSAIRAAVMASVLLVGTGFHRRTDLFNSLGAAALLILGWDTQQVFAPGFQLSFGVIAAIAALAECFTRPFERWIEPDPFVPRQLLSGRQILAWGVRHWIAGLFAVSAAAALGSLPLMFGHFHLVTPVSLVANAILVPLSFLVLGTAILTLVCGALHFTAIQVLFSNANLAFAWSAFHAAQFFASVPGGNFHLPEASLSARPPAELTVLRLPAGAASQHLRVGGHHWLLDTGTELNYALLVRPYLQSRGVDRLDGLILSHSDFEHIGATFRALRELGSPPAWEPAREPWRWETGGSSFRALHKHGLNANPLAKGGAIDLSAGDTLPARAIALYPTLEGWPRRSDDRTLVLRLDLGPFRVLWCNDAGFLAEKTMLETLPGDALRCDVLVRNQHADDFSLLPEFLDAAHPRLVVSSNDSFPPEQKLPQRIRDECAKRGVTLLDQRQTGAALLQFWPDRLEATTVRGAETRTLLPVPADTGR